MGRAAGLPGLVIAQTLAPWLAAIGASSVRLSLVTCSYQQGRFLDATLRSVIDQRAANLEYLVVDGGSTDNSVDVIQRHSANLSWWVSEPDQGQTDALIKGFERATGELQGWLCSDDLLLPGAIDRVTRFFQAHPQVDAVYGDALWINEQGDFIRAKREHGFYRFPFLFDHNFVPQPSMFWRRRLYEKVGGLDRRFNLAMDSDLWERFSRAGRIEHIPEYLSCMRFYDAQKTRRLRPWGADEDRQIRSRSPLGRTPWMQPTLRAVARAQRILLKAAAGGYRAHIDHRLLDDLQQYRLSA